MKHLKALMDAASIDTLGQLADRLIAEGVTEKRRTLEVYLRGFHDDRAAWWAKHPEAADVLAHVLGVEASDLASPPSTHGARSTPIRDLPDARALDLRRELPCHVSSVDWFGVPEKAECVWVEALPGAGRSLAASVHDARGTAYVIRARTLSDALALPDDDGWLVIDLDSLGDLADADRAASSLIRRGSVVLLAPCAPPALPSDGPQPERTQWRHERWRPTNGWRRALVEWAADRLPPGGRLQVSELLAWLESVDPAETLVRTPGDVLPFVDIAHHDGVAKLKRMADNELGAELIRRRVKQLQGATDERREWLESHAVAAVKVVIERRLALTDISLHGPLDRGTWASLLPEDVLTVPSDARRALKQKIVVSKDPKDREELLERLLGASPASAVAHLAAVGILRETAAGLLSLMPAWAEMAWTHESIRRRLDKDDPATWGRLMTSADRRDAIDDALTELDDPALIRLTERALTSPVADDLGTIYAVEALFFAWGHRLAEGVQTAPTSLLHRLWSLQSSLFLPHFESYPPAQRTRPGPGTDGNVRWLLVHWAWSLRVERTPERVPESWAWMVPGWSDAPLRSAPDWLPGLWTLERGADADVSRLIALAAEIVALRDIDDRPPARDHLFLPFVTLRLLRRGAPVEPAVLERLMVHEEATVLTREAGRLPAAEQQAIAEVLWRGLVARKGNLPGAVWGAARVEPLWAFIAERITIPAFEASLLSNGPLDDGRWIAHLPGRLKGAAVRAVCSADPTRLGQLLQYDVDLGPDAGVLLASLANSAGSWQAAATVWRLEPSMALSEASSYLVSDASARPNWFTQAPREHFEALLRLLEQAPIPDVHFTWVSGWLARRLLEGGRLAERVHALLNQCLRHQRASD